jgi:cation diffusion facilitator CzcD-associated flavoprotein CzcO
MNKKTIVIENCDLCIIGMGASGLNALNSSSQYLSKKDKVIVIDKRPAKVAIGGMWNSAYKFVRLHQPHTLFTVGNKKWNLNKDSSYLANKSEIVQYFNNCYNELKNKLSIIEKFGYEYKDCKEVKIGDEYEAHINFESINNDLPPLLVKAKRCIKATGFNVEPNKAMTFSTDKVQSITPESSLMTNSKVANDDKPVYIVGGGKTSMDVAQVLLNQNPNRKLNFILGKGTFFLNRDILFPAGIKKNWAGKTINEMFLDIALNYDKNNLSTTFEYIKKTYCLAPFKDANQHLLGLLSPHESDRIKNSADTEIYDYLVDVKEDNNEIAIHYRSGQKQQISADSWFINCTGHLYPKEEKIDPILSPHGKILSIQKTTSAIFFTTMGGYFLPHLWFQDKFKEVPVNYFNQFDLIKKDKQAYLFAISAQAILNLIHFSDALPLKLINECALNYDKWFPLHRQLPFLLNILTNKKKYIKQLTKTLDDICAEHDIENGIIGQ